MNFLQKKGLSTDRQNESSESDLPCHSGVGAHADSREKGDKDGDDGDSGRRPVLAHRSSREVDVDVRVIQILLQPVAQNLHTHISQMNK
jgi:hypothetical protein